MLQKSADPAAAAGPPPHRAELTHLQTLSLRLPEIVQLPKRFRVLLDNWVAGFQAAEQSASPDDYVTLFKVCLSCQSPSPGVCPGLQPAS